MPGTGESTGIQSSPVGAFSCSLRLNLETTYNLASYTSLASCTSLAPCTLHLLPSALETPRWRQRCRGHARFLLRRKILSRIDEAIPLEVILLIVQLLVASIGHQQLFVSSPLHNLPALEHQNLIGAANRREPVRNDKRRPSPPQRAQPVLNL